MKRRSRANVRDDLSLAILLIGIVVIGLILMLFIRVQRGLLGFVLAGLAIILLVYWLREFRKTVKKELMPEITPKGAEWAYEIIEDKDEITILAEVPGPEDQIKVEIVNGKLEIKSTNFQKAVKLLHGVSIISKSYVNGVLSVRLKRENMHRENVEKV
ncbi:MAG: hypothetical protein H3Z52_09495 [archaeon]|nr:hypothetical protein [archaeon]